MRLGLIGYGKMGREVALRAEGEGLSIAKIIDSSQGKEALEGLDLCIDFSKPAAFFPRLEQCAACGVSLVVGTTGWYDRLDEAKKLVENSKIGFLYAENFSLGMALFMELVKKAGTLLNHFPEYDLAIQEIHHKHKLDSPSGTALRMLHTLCRDIPVTSTRCGTVPGTHSLILDAEADTITLTHTAKNRSGFALGALKAAKWLHGRKGFYHFSDMVK